MVGQPVEKRASKAFRAEGLDHVRFLARLVELELIDRERRMIERRIKAAKFPAVREYLKLCVWRSAHAVKTGHLLNRSG